MLRPSEKKQPLIRDHWSAITCGTDRTKVEKYFVNKLSNARRNDSGQSILGENNRDKRTRHNITPQNIIFLIWMAHYSFVVAFILCSLIIASKSLTYKSHSNKMHSPLSLAFLQFALCHNSFAAAAAWRFFSICQIQTTAIVMFISFIWIRWHCFLSFPWVSLKCVTFWIVSSRCLLWRIRLDSRLTLSLTTWPKSLGSRQSSALRYASVLPYLINCL